MFTVVAFSQSHASVALLQLTAIADPHLPIIAGNVVVPRDLSNIIAIYAGGADIDRAQLQSPSLRQLLNPELNPVDIAAVPSTPHKLIDYRFTPIQLQPDEQLSAFEANLAAGANRAVVIVWLGDGAVQPVQGDVRSVRATSAVAAVANTWTNVPLVLDQALPAGRYAVVGGKFFSATMQAFRLVFPGLPWRPGGLGFATTNLVEPQQQRWGNFGPWGEFQHNAPPTMDVLCTAADATQAGVLDLVKIA